MKNNLTLNFVKILLLITVTFPGNAQSTHIIKGRVMNKQGEGLAFTSIYVKDGSQGTTTNDEGFYSLALKPGNYQLTYRAIGFQTTVKEITVKDTKSIQVILVAERLSQDNQSTAQNKDLANRIMRKAIRQRKKHLQEIEKFSCLAYIKGVQYLHKAPKKIMGIRIHVDTGNTYFSEILSRLNYQKGKYKEKTIASSSTGKSRVLQFTQAAAMETNLYKNMISNQGLGERGIISPLAFNAKLYYRFHYEGAIQEHGLLIHKIRLNPRRRLTPAFQGYIYIIDNDWHVYSTKLTLGKGIIPAVDTINIQQTYASLGNGAVWRPVSLRYAFKYSNVGFQGQGYYACTYTQYNITPTFQRRFFNNEVMTVTGEGNNKTNTYWQNIRLVPFTTMEATTYNKRNQRLTIRKNKNYQDSLDAQRNRLGVAEALYGGYTYRNSYHHQQISFQPLIHAIQYNTVEGLAPELAFSYLKHYKNHRYFMLEPRVRYGFSNKRWQSKLKASYYFAPKSFGAIWVEGGRYTEQLSRQESIAPITNTYYTLALERNFLKIYEKSYATLGYSQELLNGLYLKGSIEFAERSPLQNTTDYKWSDRKDREFSSNTPINSELTNTDFVFHQALTFNASLRFNLRQKYILYPNHKFVMSTHFPSLQIDYRKGVAVGASDIDYDLLQATIEDNFRLGVLGAGKYSFKAGIFLNTNKMYLTDFQHFTGNQTLLSSKSYQAFQLLEYYKYSTQDRYLEGHYAHHFNGFVMNGIPLINRLKAQLVLSANYLWTPQALNYLELGIGLENIFKIYRVDIITSIQEGQQMSIGARIGFGF